MFSLMVFLTVVLVVCVHLLRNIYPGFIQAPQIITAIYLLVCYNKVSSFFPFPIVLPPAIDSIL